MTKAEILKELFFHKEMLNSFLEKLLLVEGHQESEADVTKDDNDNCYFVENCNRDKSVLMLSPDNEWIQLHKIENSKPGMVIKFDEGDPKQFLILKVVFEGEHFVKLTLRGN